MTIHVKSTDIARSVDLARAQFLHQARRTSMTAPTAKVTQLIKQAIDLLQPVSMAKLAKELGTSTRVLQDLRGDGAFLQPGCNAHRVLAKLTDKVAKLPPVQATTDTLFQPLRLAA